LSSPVGRLLNWHHKGSGRFWLGEKIHAATGFQEGFSGWGGRPAIQHPPRPTAKSDSIENTDLWIAADARSAGLTLVTNNAREFRRVPGLALENWAERPG
jgi:hypothetical protein